MNANKLLISSVLIFFSGAVFADELDTYRTQINDIDSQIIKLIAERNQVSVKVGAYKKQHNLPIYAPEREAKLKEKHVEMAKADGVSPVVVTDVFDIIIANSRNLQE